MDARCRIEMLGGLRAVQGDRVITRFRSQKTGSLLGYLAYYLERPHPREVLIDLFWPESDPLHGRHNLCTTLSSLRHQLEPPGVPAGAVFIADRTSLRLNPNAVSTDIGDLQTALEELAGSKDTACREKAIARAEELYRGELLSGYYDDWIDAERKRLAEAMFSEFSTFARSLAGTKELRKAIKYAGMAVDIDPLRESAHRDLMTLYAATGNRPATIRQYRELERILSRDLGVPPSAATRALYERLVPEGESSAVESVAPAPTRRGSGRTPDSRPRTRTTKAGPSAPQDHPALPPRLTRFFGREEEIARLVELVSGGVMKGKEAGDHSPLTSHPSRLVTLTGSGGNGKTRLAIEVADRICRSTEWNVCFVPLADLRDPRLILESMRDSLRLPRIAGVDTLDQVVTALSSGPTLLLLDNFEQLLSDDRRKAEDGSALVRMLLERHPTLTCLVTSRRRLDLAGEQEYPVGPLPVPAVAAGPDVVTGFSSVRLFVNRAQLVRPDFQVTERNAAAVAELCGRLEGIPLALELAASRAQVFTPAQMLEQLQDRFNLLVSRKRDAEERHRTLRASIDWSVRLMGPELRRLFRDLSIFRGGWTVEGAEAVCDDPLALDGLAMLQECSLVLSEESNGTMRFRMLETLREYAAVMMPPDKRDAVARRHAEFFASQADSVSRVMWSPEEEDWFNAIEAERDNIDAALDWLLQNDPARALRFAGNLIRFWYVRGYFEQGRRWLDATLAETDGVSKERALAYNGLGILARDQGAFAEALDHLSESLKIYREIDDRHGAASALNNIGLIETSTGDYASAGPHLEESISLQAQVGNPSGAALTRCNLGLLYHFLCDHERAKELCREGLAAFRETGHKWGTATALNHLGTILAATGDLDDANAMQEESLSISRELSSKTSEALALNALGDIALKRAQYDRARELFTASLAEYWDLRNKWGVAWVLSNIAALDYRTDNAERAAVFFAAAGFLRESVGQPIPPCEKPDHDAFDQSLRQTLGEEKFARLTASGRLQPWDQVVVRALERVG